MKFCSKHWEMLRQAIKDRGLWHLVATSGEDVAKRMRQGDFEPLMAAHNAIAGAALQDGGLDILQGDKCPVCCASAANPELEKDWIDGASDDSLRYAREMKLVAVQ